MKIRIERDVLADAVAWTARALGNPRTGGNPGIGITAAGDKVTFVAYDRESSAQAEFDAVVEQDGTCVVPGRLLSDITKTLPAAPVVLNLNGSSIDVECGRSSFSLPTINSADFPKMSEMPDAIGTITGAEFAEAVAQAHIAAGTNDSLVNFSGIRLEVNKNTMTMAATDRYRLAIRDVEWTPTISDADTAVLVPASRLNDIAKGLSHCEKVEISVASTGDGTLIGFSGDGRSIATSLLGYEFPPKYRDLIPPSSPVTAYVETASLLAALKRVRLVLENNAYVAMQVGDNDVKLIAKGLENAVATETVDAAVEGEIERVQFNPNYFIDGLTAVGAPYVRLAFTQSTKPVVITGAQEIGGAVNDDYQYLLMPMRANS